MMITFSITSRSIVRWSDRYMRRGLGPAALRTLLFPARDGAPQLKVRDRARKRRQPEREAAVDEHRDDRQARVDVEREQRADHAGVDAADPTGQRQQARQQAHEVRLRTDRQRRRLAEGLE